MDLKKIKSIHFTGIKGVGMTALALCAKDLGIKVTGSDIEEYFVTDETLKNAGISWKLGFKKENIGHPDLLVFTAAHGGQVNVEVIAAEAKNIPVLSHAQALGLLMKGKQGISVCGVGGKTTISAMMATIFSSADFYPSFAVGAAKIDPLGNPGKYNKKGRYFIAEADEYFTSPQNPKPRFFYQDPKIVAISNIEFDHPDVYKNLNQTLEVFQVFAGKVPKDGLVVIYLDNPNNRKLLQLIKVPVVTYGFSPQANWRITSINQSSSKLFFNLEHKGFAFNNLVLSVPGKFNVENAAAALIVANFCGIPFERIKEGLKQFKGTKRRFEFIEEVNGVRLYDDYAHHPIQIKATLRTAKEWFKNRKIIVIFQPHTYSRTKALLKDFSRSFVDADLVIITDIYTSAREKRDPCVSAELLTREIRKFNQNVIYKRGEKEVAGFLKLKAKKGDIIFTLGAGNIFNWHDKIIQNLKCHPGDGQPLAEKMQNYADEKVEHSRSKHRNNSKFKIRKNVKLAPYTSFNIGGPADYFCKAKTKEDIIEAVNWVKKKRIDYFILGGGSNILIGDKGIRGLVIQVKSSKLKVQSHNSKFKIIADAGVRLANLIQLATGHSLTGLEFLAGIPGTIGGAIVGNAGTKKGSIAQAIEKVIILGEDGLIYDLNNRECQFDYRQSRFQKTKEIIIEVVFALRKEKPELIREKIAAGLKTRKNQFKDRTAGSIFKNPALASAGYLIEKTGLKGRKIGEAMISKKHANWIINLGNASAADVLELISLIKKKVKQEFKIQLEEEIRLVGEF